MFPSSGRSAAGLLHLLIGIVAAAAALVWPLTPALAPADVSASRIGCALLALTVSVAIALARERGRPTTWSIAAAVSALCASVLLWQYVSAGTACVGDHDGRPVVIGRELTPEAQARVLEDPDLSSTSELLLDVGGQTQYAWTARSIASCRFWVSWGGLLVLPLLATCLSSIVAGRRSAWRWSSSLAKAPVQSAAAGAPRYDAFVSYRRLDRERAEMLVEELESRGFRLAIDFRDFQPNELVLTEMERCIRESRFLLCVITEQYASSGFTTEEAAIARLLDLTERRNRTVPLIFDKVPMPAWLQGLVGIDFGPDAQAEPIERLVRLLSSKTQGAA